MPVVNQAHEGLGQRVYTDQHSKPAPAKSYRNTAERNQPAAKADVSAEVAKAMAPILDQMKAMADELAQLKSEKKARSGPKVPA